MQLLTNWLNYLIKFGLLLVLICFYGSSHAQNLTLERACQLAEEQYPLTKQKALIEQTFNLTIQNLNRSYLPQFSVNGQATYQSEVTAIDIPLPGIKFDPLSKDQYKLTADVSQVIYDGGLIRQQQIAQQLNTETEQQKLEVELYKLRDRIAQLYTGVLYLNAQMKQVAISRGDLDIGIKTIEAQIANGVAFRSALNVLKAEALRTDQRLIELKATRKGMLETLGLFLNQTLPEQIVLETPAVKSIINENVIRPELQLYKSQKEALKQQNNIIHARNLPKTAAFFQGGYGRPGLNFLKNSFEPYYIVGVRLNWSLGGLYTSKREKELIEINQRVIDVQKETFLLNTNAQLKQQDAEIEKLQQLITTDNEIIALRKSIKEAAKAQLENNVITANDYLREVNAEDAARQNLNLHQLQLIQAQINYRNIKGEQ